MNEKKSYFVESIVKIALKIKMRMKTKKKHEFAPLIIQIIMKSISGTFSSKRSKIKFVQMAYRQLEDFAQGEGRLGEMSIGGSARWENCQLGDFNLSDFLGIIFILIHFYLMNATNEHNFLNKTYLINNEF